LVAMVNMGSDQTNWYSSSRVNDCFSIIDIKTITGSKAVSVNFYTM